MKMEAESSASVQEGCPVQFFDRDMKPDPETHDQICHTDCIRCSPQVSDGENLLCPSCRHIRPRHLLLCVPKETWHHLILGNLAELKQRPHCSLCRVIVQLVARNVGNAEKDHHTVVDDECLCLLRPPRQQFASHLRDALLLQVSFTRGSSWMPPYFHLLFRFQDIDIAESCIPGVLHDRLCSRDLSLATLQYHSSRSPTQQVAGFLPVREQITWGPIFTWLACCEMLHSSKCGALTPTQSSRPTRLIDTQNLCIVVAPQDCRYITLSYVWGKTNKAFHLTRANIEELQQKGSLATRWNDIPLTIADAIKVCSKLAEKYLWVDSLCILQDDVDSKQREIDSMGDTYASSALTIIAAAGDCAWSGLPGVSTVPRLSPQATETFDSLQVMEMLPSLSQEMETSAWNKRGWTYQEAILATRALIFTSTQVFFQCNTNLHHEDPCIGDAGHQMWKSNRSSVSLKKGGPLKYDRFTEFSRLLGEYTKRELSFYGDIFDAFAGISHTIYDQPSHSFIFGLPSHDFDEVMLWIPAKRLPGQGRFPTDAVIPSWSWGYCGRAVTFLLDCEEYIGSLLKYHVCMSESHGLTPVIPNRDWTSWPPRPESIYAGASSEPDISRDIYRTIAVKEGCFAAGNERESPGETTSESLSLDGYDAELVRKATYPGRLLFNAQAAKFNIEDHSHLNDDDNVFFPYDRQSGSSPVLSIFNKHGRLAGFMTFDREEEFKNRPLQDANSPPTYEMIALSIARSQDVDGYEDYVEYQVAHSIISNRDLPSIGERNDPCAPMSEISKGLYVGDRAVDVRYYDSEGGRIRTPLVNVMLISWVEGVAHREGLGQIYLARWKDAEPKTKTIILE